MDILEFRGPHGWLQIYCVVIDATKSPLAAQGYQHLRYAIGGHGFSGEGDGFVTEDQLRGFCEALIALAMGERVEPRLSESESEAGGLTVTLCAGSEPDRTSVEGRIVRKSYRTLSESDGLYTWVTQFGFWIHHYTLSGVRKVRWVEHYAG